MAHMIRFRYSVNGDSKTQEQAKVHVKVDGILKKGGLIPKKGKTATFGFTTLTQAKVDAIKDALDLLLNLPTSMNGKTPTARLDHIWFYAEERPPTATPTNASKPKPTLARKPAQTPASKRRTP